MHSYVLGHSRDIIYVGVYILEASVNCHTVSAARILPVFSLTMFASGGTCRLPYRFYELAENLSYFHTIPQKNWKHHNKTNLPVADAAKQDDHNYYTDSQRDEHNYPMNAAIKVT